MFGSTLFGGDTRPKIKRSSINARQGNEDEPDPNGDVTLVVSPPATPRRYKTVPKGFDFTTAKFAAPLLPAATPPAADTATTATSSTENTETPPATTPTAPTVTPSTATASDPESLFGPPPTTQPAAEAPAGTISGSAQSTNEVTKPNTSKSRFRVSSKLLMLASVYFQKMFSGQWREGQELNANESVELEMPDTDPKAFLIILNIIHLRGSVVPQYVDLETLTELAVLTDYFQCHDALGPYPVLWREGQTKYPGRSAMTL